MTKTDFETQWQKTVESFVEPALVSAKVKIFLGVVYQSASAEPPEIERLRFELEQLLVFLATPEGRTNANCWAADIFLLLVDGWDLEKLPEELADIMADMAGALHDTVEHPDEAENFGGLPEQLLARLRSIELPK